MRPGRVWENGAGRRRHSVRCRCRGGMAVTLHSEGRRSGEREGCRVARS